MSKVVSMDAHRKLDYDTIQLYEGRLYHVDLDKFTFTLTEEGRRYYGMWFSRFGYTLNEADPEAFFKTVRDIVRAQDEAEPLSGLIAGDKLSADERELWTMFIEGQYDQFTQKLVAMGEEARTRTNERILSFPRQSSSVD